MLYPMNTLITYPSSTGCFLFRIETGQSVEKTKRATRLVAELVRSNNSTPPVFIKEDTDVRRDSFLLFWDAFSAHALHCALSTTGCAHTYEDLTETLLNGACFRSGRFDELFQGKNATKHIKTLLQVHLSVDDLLDRICAHGFHALHPLEKELLDDFSQKLVF
jgi:hypothetical protein